MPATKLTRTSVEALAAREKPWIMYDAELKGFGVRVGASGAKSWIVEYRPGAGGRSVSTKRVKLGTTSVLTIEEARKAARIVLAKARLGDDLADQRERDRSMPTVEEFSKDFLRKHVQAKRKASTLKTYTDHFVRLINPVIGRVKVHLLTPEMVTDLHLKVGEDNGRGIANRCLISLSSMYGWGYKTKKLKDNPVEFVERFPESFQERYLSSDEIAAIGAALVEGETVGLPWKINEAGLDFVYVREENRRTILDPFVAAAIRLLLLTGCRTGELLNLRWDDVDLERGILFLPDSKTGKKPILLSSYAVSVLDSLPRIGPYVIVGRDPEKARDNFRKSWASVLRCAGIKHCRLHDLRHTNASIGAGMGIGLPVLGALLGHSSTETTKRYAHIANDPARRAAEAIGLSMAGAIVGPQHGEHRTIN